MSRQAGQALVEFTLSSVLLLMIFFGIVDFSLAYSTGIKIRNAVAEGGYYASQNPGDESGIRAQIRQELRDLNPPIEDADITIQTTCETRDSAETEISVSYEYDLFFGIFGPTTSITLSSATTMPQMGGC
jgi:Flp pilus assembly protein TadG